MSEIRGEELAIACAKAAEEIQAENISVIDLRGLSSLTDFMIICSGNSMPHLKAVLREISNTLLVKHGAKPTYMDGNAEARWVVLDFVDVMVHVMIEEMRDVYALEDIWENAVKLDWQNA